MVGNLFGEHLVLPRHDHLKGLAKEGIERLSEAAPLDLGVLHHLMDGHQCESAHLVLLRDRLVNNIEKLAGVRSFLEEAQGLVKQNGDSDLPDLLAHRVLEHAPQANFVVHVTFEVGQARPLRRVLLQLFLGVEELLVSVLCRVLRNLGALIAPLV